MKHSNKEQRDQIQEFIQDELLKRGFHAPIIKFEEKINRFSFTTSKFQTTPVLFKSIIIGNFSSSITPDGEFWIQVNIHYQHFSGGQNSSSLFEITGTLIDGRVSKINIR